MKIKNAPFFPLIGDFCPINAPAYPVRTFESIVTSHQVIVPFSGGIDSTLLLQMVIQSARKSHKEGKGVLNVNGYPVNMRSVKFSGCELIPVLCDYGQHTFREELAAAKRIYAKFEEHEIPHVDTSVFRKVHPLRTVTMKIPTNSRIMNHDVHFGKFHPAYVPFRNALFILNILAAVGGGMKSSTVLMGTNLDDYNNVFPDCMPLFAGAINNLLESYCQKGVQLEVMFPFMNISKKDITENLHSILLSASFSGYGNTLASPENCKSPSTSNN